MSDRRQERRQSATQRKINSSTGSLVQKNKDLKQ